MRDIALAIMGAALIGFPAYLLRIPLILAYLAAGVLLGPHLGFGLIHATESIETLSQIGLVLLMFILGLEMDLGKFLQAGKAVLINGVVQFTGCLLMAGGLFYALGYGIGDGKYDLVYLAFGCAMSSTLIVIKILSDKFDLNTLVSRITLGILVIQDLWAISFLAVQPNLAQLNPMVLVTSLGRGMLLVLACLWMAKYVLPHVFAKVGKQPELMIVFAMAWCFAAAGVANMLHLSQEMGALIGGISIASFPYKVDVAAKVTNLRDFFITVFFVVLGLQVPKPTPEIVTLALVIVGFVLVSRVITIFPVLYRMNYGNRVSLIPGVNLSQVSEFALIFASLGVAYGHISTDILNAFIIAIIITALISSTMIPQAHFIFKSVNPILERLGFKDSVSEDHVDGPTDTLKPQVVLLGFFREASSLLRILMNRHSETALQNLLVVDYNPEAHHKLKELGINCMYGDVASQDTLNHINFEKTKLLVCTIPDYQLRGTSNLKLLRTLKRLAPKAAIIVTSETIDSAREMYKQGADYVFVPRIISAHYLSDIVDRISSGSAGELRTNAKKFLDQWDEVLG